MAFKSFLHVGCGRITKQALKGFNSDEWHEVRFDIDPDVHPDIVGTITDMSGVESESVDAVFSSHNVEHVYPHQVPQMLRELLRVLRPGGFLVVTCPDLRSVCAALIQTGPMAVLYQSSMGPITPLDILYGHIASVQAGNEYMAHKGGFSIESLCRQLSEAGFGTLHGGARSDVYDLWVLAFKGEVSNEEAQVYGEKFLP